MGLRDPSEIDERFRVDLFDGLSAAEWAWIVDHSREVHLDTGAYFARENDPADRFYVVLSGELQISRTVDGRETIIGTTPRGIIGGELALLNQIPTNYSACAITPCDLLVFDVHAFRSLFAAVPSVGARVLQTAASRMNNFASLRKQQEKMAALGKLSAGLAHELNNPAAAARRSTQSLRAAWPDLQAHTVTLSRLGLQPDQVDVLLAAQEIALAHLGEVSALSSLEQSDREEEMGDWLSERDIDESWEMANAFVLAQLTVDDLAGLADRFRAEQVPAVLAWLYGTLMTTRLLNEIEESTGRISELVGAVKAYTYMDQAQTQEVNIHKGLENTVTMLNHKLRDIKLIREYDQTLPTIVARGSELNQVWTNLVDNAADALSGRPDGEIHLVTRDENNFVMVEVADNGPGIPAEIMPRLFEPFFTTKEVGSGTGLGLDVSYRIVSQHKGTIEVQSEPGHTRFIVRLPIHSKMT